jgi:hypothetical protein
VLLLDEKGLGLQRSWSAAIATAVKAVGKAQRVRREGWLCLVGMHGVFVAVCHQLLVLQVDSCGGVQQARGA